MASKKLKPELGYGRIIWASVRDRRGFRKDRPCIIISRSEDIRADRPIAVMAVTTTFSDPPPHWHVTLPWNNDPRRVVTRLSERSAAVVEWLDWVDPRDVLDFGGEVPAAKLAEIDRLLKERAKDVPVD